MPTHRIGRTGRPATATTPTKLSPPSPARSGKNARHNRAGKIPHAKPTTNKDLDHVAAGPAAAKPTCATLNQDHNEPHPESR